MAKIADHSREHIHRRTDPVLVAEFAFLLSDRYDTINRAELIEALAVLTAI